MDITIFIAVLLMYSMEKMVPFVAKVSTVKTRAREDKNYFVFRMNIPKEATQELKLINGDHLFLHAMKAKWYHMLDWKEMPDTWEMLPEQLKIEITVAGLAPPEKLKMPQAITSPTRHTFVREPPVTTETSAAWLEVTPQVN